MKWTLGQDNQGGAKLKLNGDLTLDSAAELQEALKQALQAASEIVIELDSNAEVDLSCLQLFCAAHQTALSQGLKLSLAPEHPQKFQELTCSAGLCREKKCAIRPEMACLLARGYQ